MKEEKRRKKFFVGIMVLALPLPFGGIYIAYRYFGKFILDNPDFWYGYMAYFGTVLLAIVAGIQNIEANEVNERFMKQQLRQKIGYFELKKEAEQTINVSNQEIKILNGYQMLKVENPMNFLGLEDRTGSLCLKICLKNVGEDVILNLKILSGNINKKEVKVPCSNKVVYKEEEMWFEIDCVQHYHEKELQIDMVLQMENIAGASYKQNISIEIQKLFYDEENNNYQLSMIGKEIMPALYYVTKFGSSIDFEN